MTRKERKIKGLLERIRESIFFEFNKLYGLTIENINSDEQLYNTYFRIRNHSNWKFRLVLEYIPSERPYTIQNRDKVQIRISVKHCMMPELQVSEWANSFNEESMFYPLWVHGPDGVIVGFDMESLDNLSVDLNKFRMIWTNEYLAYWIYKNVSLNIHYVSKLKAFLFYQKTKWEVHRNERKEKKIIKRQVKFTHRYFKSRGYDYQIFDTHTEMYHGIPRYRIYVWIDPETDKEELWGISDEWFEANEFFLNKYGREENRIASRIDFYDANERNMRTYGK